MKVLVVYDSVYGNTEMIAKTIGSALTGEVHVRRASEVSPPDLESVDLLVVGSPTQAGRPIAPVQAFLKALPKLAAGVAVAAFDTSMPMKWVGVFGYAAPRIAGVLKKRGGTLAAPTQAFFVNDKAGPLREGETARAADWARRLSMSRH